jgi:4,5-DOPA dioxygenase extradiol
MKMPVLFIGHGSPMNIILKNDYTRRLAELGEELPGPSIHLITGGTSRRCGPFMTWPRSFAP